MKPAWISRCKIKRCYNKPINYGEWGYYCKKHAPKRLREAYKK